MMPNDEKKGVQRLRDLHRARPRGMKPLRRIVYVVALAPGELEQAQADYPTAEVRPIKFSFAELGAAGVRMFMGASKNASFYMRKVDGIIANLKDFTLAGFLAAIDATDWTTQQEQPGEGAPGPARELRPRRRADGQGPAPGGPGAGGHPLAEDRGRHRADRVRVA